MSAMEQLLRISGPSLIPSRLPDGIPALEPFGGLGYELYDLLAARNGFYAFESALHVFPFGTCQGVLDLATWNAPSTWRSEYADLAEGHLFFAEDLFGFQFSLHEGKVCTFDAETGSATELAASLEEWAAKLLVDFRNLVGHPVAHDWQVANGALRPGRRLAPRIPFVLGGTSELSELHEAEQIDLMRFLGNIASQIRDLPDGTTVKLKVVD